MLLAPEVHPRDMFWDLEVQQLTPHFSKFAAGLTNGKHQKKLWFCNYIPRKPCISIQGVHSTQAEHKAHLCPHGGGTWTSFKKKGLTVLSTPNPTQYQHRRVAQHVTFPSLLSLFRSFFFFKPFLYWFKSVQANKIVEGITTCVCTNCQIHIFRWSKKKWHSQPAKTMLGNRGRAKYTLQSSYLLNICPEQCQYQSTALHVWEQLKQPALVWEGNRPSTPMTARTSPHWQQGNNQHSSPKVYFLPLPLHEWPCWRSERPLTCGTPCGTSQTGWEDGISAAHAAPEKPAQPTNSTGWTMGAFKELHIARSYSQCSTPHRRAVGFSPAVIYTLWAGETSQ